jgi:hypothetical protein
LTRAITVATEISEGSSPLRKELHMNPQRLGGIALLVVGAILFTIGMNASESFADRFSNFFTGHYTDRTVWYVIGGAALVVVGLMLAMLGGRRVST